MPLVLSQVVLLGLVLLLGRHGALITPSARRSATAVELVVEVVFVLAGVPLPATHDGHFALSVFFALVVHDLALYSVLFPLLLGNALSFFEIRGVGLCPRVCGRQIL